jgi:hypothetical protein
MLSDSKERNVPPRRAEYRTLDESFRKKVLEAHLALRRLSAPYALGGSADLPASHRASF